MSLAPIKKPLILSDQRFHGASGASYNADYFFNSMDLFKELFDLVFPGFALRAVSGPAFYR
jgi:hypothetical protein